MAIVTLVITNMFFAPLVFYIRLMALIFMLVYINAVCCDERKVNW